jgi:tetratricopeptide (TPR) repeat protein
VCIFCSTVGLAETESWETLNTAGMMAYQEKNFVTAKELFERALQTLEQSDRPDPHAATTFNNLGAVHERMGEYEQAELRYRNSLALIELIQGPDHPDIAMGLNNLASMYFSQQAFAKAEPLWKRALSISENILGDHHPHLVQPLVTLGLVTQAQGKYEQAEPLYLRAIRITEHALSPEHPRLIPLYERYSSLLHQAGRHEEAEVIGQKIESLRAANGVAPEKP